jgi:hypothetical protein
MIIKEDPGMPDKKACFNAFLHKQHVHLERHWNILYFGWKQSFFVKAHCPELEVSL